MQQVSVIVPVYNAEKYLEICVNSVLHQSYSNFELLLIDDGSLDNSPDLCDMYAAADSRVKVIHKKNGGVSSARNVGLNAARGRYIMFLDSDDYIDNRFLEIALTRCEEQNLDIFAGGIATECDGKIIDVYRLGASIVKDINDLTQQEYCALLQNNYISSSCNKLIARAYIGELRFDEQCSYGEDLRFVFTLLEKSGRIAAVPDVFYFYRKYPDSSSRHFDDQKIKNLVDTYSFLCSFAEKKELPMLEELIQHRWVNECRFAQNMVIYSSKPFFVQYRRLRKLRQTRKFRNWVLRLGDKETKEITSKPAKFLLKRGFSNLRCKLDRRS